MEGPLGTKRVFSPGPTEPALSFESEINVPKDPLVKRIDVFSNSSHITKEYNRDFTELSLPGTVDPSSIFVLSSDGSYVPFLYFPKTEAGSIFTRAVEDGNIKAVAVKDRKAVEGTLLSMNGDDVMISYDSNVTMVRNYDTLEIQEIAMIRRPTIKLESSCCNSKITVSCVLDGVRWDCIGTCVVDTLDNTISLRIAGILHNETGEDITASVTLVSGNVYQTGEAFPRQAMALASGRESRKEMSKGEDFVRHDIGVMTIRESNIIEIKTLKAPVLKVYSHEIFASGENIVNVGYRFTSPEHIPECGAKVYLKEKGSVGRYIGASPLKETRKGEQVYLSVGESTLVRCYSTVRTTGDEIADKEALFERLGDAEDVEDAEDAEDAEDVKGAKWHIVTKEIKVTMKNHSESPAVVVLKHFIGDSLLFNSSCEAKEELGTIEWYIELLPTKGKETEVFSCVVSLAELR